MRFKKFLPSIYYNPISMAGSAVSLVSFMLIIFLYVMDSIAEHSRPYIGIIAFVILPVFFIGGLLLVAFGMRLEKRRRARAGVEHGEYPSIDFNNPAHRKKFGFLAVITLFVFLASAFGSYQVYDFTESVVFCGEICHDVMKPEYTAYRHSPHARVTCAECHVGSGADWYVKSKISGAYQILSVTFNLFSRPIPTPVHNLRPAQGTCEQCHWPQHFISDKQVTKTYYAQDEKNSPWSVSLLMKVSGGHLQTGTTSGIHWHVNPENAVTYTSIDSQRQVIPVVHISKPNGYEDVYVTTDDFDTTKLATGEKRKMDCIDCHNRPTHIYRTPEESINSLMSAGLVSPKLPSIRTIASSAFTKEYATETEALKGIEKTIRDSYSITYPEVGKKHKSEIDSAIVSLQRTYSYTIFPEMKANWTHYPNNVGHYAYAGCFRCHDGKHVSKKTGAVISKDCNTCHTILSQGPNDKLTHLSPKGEEFIHPVDIGDSWQTMNCNDCHTGE
ncbi:MAG: NapC/NirT family cytochrome c [Bacteroidetes bacterium]|nr:NapC/NirT family cytochrome c [Bacteroidota bacterium]